MGFHNVVFPDKFLGRDAATGPGHATFFGEEPDSGKRETRPSRYASPRRVFDVSVDTMSRAEAAELLAFVRARRGSTHSFLLKDPRDFTTNFLDPASGHGWGDVNLGTDAVGNRRFFELFKDYGAPEGRRYLRRPIPGTVQLARDAVQLTEGVDFCVDHFLGKVLIVSPTAGAYTAGCEFYNKVRFDTSVDESMRMSLDEFEQCSTQIRMVEDNTERVVDLNGVTRSLDRASYSPETTTAGGYFNLAWRPQAVSLQLDWSMSRSVHLEPSGIVDVYLPNAVGKAGVSIATGGPHFIIHNRANGPTTILQLKEWTDASSTKSAFLQNRSRVLPRSLRTIWLDDKSNWRAV